MKLRTKLILKGLFHSLLQMLLIFSFAIFNDCIIEMAIIYICFFLFRTKFEKQYHALTSWGCTFLTIIIFFIISLIYPNKSISMVLVILFTYFINTISYIYRDYLDIKNLKEIKENNEVIKKKCKTTNRQLIIEIMGKDNLDEDSITNKCVELGYPYLAETIYLFLNNTLETTADILDVDVSTITRRIKKFIKVGLEK